MSIQTELARLTNAKAAIQSAIESKGVTVPSGTLLDGMAALIDAIEAGGGGKIATGTVIPANDNSITIEHGLGEVPNVFFWCTTDFVNHTTTSKSGSLVVESISNSDTFCGGYIDGQSFVLRTVSSHSNNHKYMLYSNNQDSYSRKLYRLNSNNISSDNGMLAYKMAGETVRWIAAVV